MKIQIINGPNINLLGKREPGIYGNQSFEDYLLTLKQRYPDVEIAYYQSNCEGNLIDKLQEVGFDVDGIILNAGAYTHTSIALQDAIRAIKAPAPDIQRILQCVGYLVVAIKCLYHIVDFHNIIHRTVDATACKLQ